MVFFANICTKFRTNKSIFIPAAGYYHQTGQYTYITTKENQYEPYTGLPMGTVKQAKNTWVGGELILSEGLNSNGFAGATRYTGMPVRPVKDRN